MSAPPRCVYVQALRFGRSEYYCPKCDRAIPKERLEERDAVLRNRFGVSKLSDLRCPVCDTEFIDLDKCKEGGSKYVGKTRRQSGSD